MNILSANAWDQFIETRYPNAHLLQTAAWGELKASFNWSPRFFRIGDAGAMLLFRRLPFGFSIAYIPRGPIGHSDWNSFWAQIDGLCQQERAIFLRVEPEIWQPATAEHIIECLPGFVPSDQTVQPPSTIRVDLQASEDDILMAMKPKTRYNIRLAERKGVTVRSSSDVGAFHRMMQTTGQRDGFGIHTLAYYQRAYDLFAPQGSCVLLIAEYKGQALAGLMAFKHGETAWYFYGASTDQERNRMPTYLLQWEAMRWAKRGDCKVYDLWGVPDYPENMLEKSFMERSDGLWSVYRFKRGFSGDICRTIGAWERVYHKSMYKLYQIWTRRIKSSIT
jgi:peptidoglycan pentaglycine glycine transferase (the first glycine)